MEAPSPQHLAAHASEQSWWRRVGGGREFLQVALPLVVSTLSWTVLTFIDSIFLMNQSSAAMAAAFCAGAMWFAILCVPLGICSYANTFIAQYHGDNQPRRIGPVVAQALLAAVVSLPIIALSVPLAPTIFSLAGHAPEVRQHEIVYFQVLCLGGPAMWICAALQSFYSGRGLTRVNMWIDAGCSALNVLLDYLWIFGRGGFPEMGVAGAAWATNAALWAKVLIYVVLLLRRQNRLRFDTLAGVRWDPELFRRLIRYGGPSGVQMLLDVLGFTIFVMLVGRLGAIQLEATSLAFRISTFGFMPVWGFGMAASILVGQRLGENRADLAERSSWTALAVALGYMGCVSVCYLLAPNVFLYGFFIDPDYDPEVQLAVHQMAVTLLRFVAAYNMFDAALMVFVNVLKGAGDTRFILNVSFVMAVLLAAASWAGVEALHLGVYGCWAIVTLWIWGFGVIYWLRFRAGYWKSMRVIQQRDPVMDDQIESTSQPLTEDPALASP